MIQIALMILVSSSSCDLIHDKDQRELCRSLNQNDSRTCDLIQDHDKRELCRGVVRNPKT